MDFQTKNGRLKKRRRNIAWITPVVLFSLFVVFVLWGVKELAENGAEYQCARLAQQFKESPEVFFITPIESKMCPELQAPVKELIN